MSSCTSRRRRRRCASSFAGDGWPGPVPGSATSVDDVVNHWVEVQRGPSDPRCCAAGTLARLRALELFRRCRPGPRAASGPRRRSSRARWRRRASPSTRRTRLDIAGPLGLPVGTPTAWRTSRAWPIRTLPYAFTRAGETPPGAGPLRPHRPRRPRLGVRRARRPDHGQRPRGPGLPHRGAPPRPADAPDVTAAGPDAAASSRWSGYADAPSGPSPADREPRSGGQARAWSPSTGGTADTASDCRHTAPGRSWALVQSATPPGRRGPSTTTQPASSSCARASCTARFSTSGSAVGVRSAVVTSSAT